MEFSARSTRWDHVSLCLGLAVLWLVLAVHYRHVTPAGSRNRDFTGHVEYTQLILTKHRLPAISEVWEGHQPPLYYLACALVGGENRIHVNRVRLLSTMFGTATVFLMAFLLIWSEVEVADTVLATLFFATTPCFFYTFVAYSNDSLLNALMSGAFVSAFLYLFTADPHPLALVSAGACALLAAFTKYSAVTACVAVAGAAVLTCWSLGVRRRTLLLVAALALSAAAATAFFLIRPKLTHGPTIPMPFAKSLSIWGAVPRWEIFVPGVGRLNWWTPGTAHKNDYLSYNFVSSLFGEWYPGRGISRRVPRTFYGFILLAHLTATVLILKRREWLATERFSAAVIVLAALGQLALVLRYPIQGFMDYRYVAWTWMPWTLLFAAGLKGEMPPAERNVLRGCLGVAVVGQLTLLSLLRMPPPQ